MSIIKNNKNYGTRVKVEAVQPVTFPEYLTVTYVVPEADANFKILNTTDNISGYRIKGATVWETPATTINVTAANVPALVLEFNLADNTKVADYQFNMITNVCKVELPATVTTLSRSCFFNCRCLAELPNLTNVTNIGRDVFYSVPIIESTYVIDDNKQRTWTGTQGIKCSNYGYVNGTLFAYMNGSFENALTPNNHSIDWSDGIDGLAISRLNLSLYRYTLPTVKFPSTLATYNGEPLSQCNITDVYFYGTTPPRAENNDSKFFRNCTVTGSIYVPSGSVDAYKAVASELFYGNDYTNSIVAMP